MRSDFDKDLQAYFTDFERLRETFNTFVAAPTLTKRLLVIHGVGGVGKSSLLRMFRLHCKGAHVPVALASGDEVKSALDVLYFKSPSGEERGWAADLKADGIALPTFTKTYKHYCAIQAKVDEQAKKAQDARGRAAEIAGKVASETVEAAVSVIVGVVVGSAIIPGVGTAVGAALGGVLGEVGGEALVAWLRGFLTKPDIDLLLDPAKKLTDDFLADVAKVADKRRIVLMLDTFEKMSALNDWVREVAERLPTNALFVIAGRALPSWSRAWDDWMARAQVEELKPMAEDHMRELARRYYATMRGGEPEPAQVEAIIRFACGLPMVVTSAMQLWVKYGVEDFQAVKPEIVANLVDRLMEGVPKELTPALKAAAIVRWFDQPILREVMEQDDVHEVYNELRRFPFVRSRTEGLALHDAVREIMDENLRAQDSERHCKLHQRAAAYFEKQPNYLEAAYHYFEVHKVQSCDKSAKLLCDNLAALMYAGLSRAALDQLERFNPEQLSTSMWLRTREAIGELAVFLGDYTRAVQCYETIFGESEEREVVLTPRRKADLRRRLGKVYEREGKAKLALTEYESGLKELKTDDIRSVERARLLKDMAWARIRLDDIDGALELCQEGLNIVDPARDPTVAGELHNLRVDISLRKEDLLEAERHIEESLRLFREVGDKYNLALAYDFLGGLRQAQGRIPAAFRAYGKALRKSEDLGHKRGVAGAYNGIASLHFQQGSYEDARNYVERALALFRELGDKYGVGMSLQNLGETGLREGKYCQALSHWEQALDIQAHIEDMEGMKTILGLLDEMDKICDPSLICAGEPIKAGIERLRAKVQEELKRIQQIASTRSE